MFLLLYVKPLENLVLGNRSVSKKRGLVGTQDPYMMLQVVSGIAPLTLVRIKKDVTLRLVKIALNKYGTVKVLQILQKKMIVISGPCPKRNFTSRAKS